MNWFSTLYTVRTGQAVYTVDIASTIACMPIYIVKEGQNAWADQGKL